MTTYEYGLKSIISFSRDHPDHYKKLVQSYLDYHDDTIGNEEVEKIIHFTIPHVEGIDFIHVDFKNLLRMNEYYEYAIDFDQQNGHFLTYSMTMDMKVINHA